MGEAKARGTYEQRKAEALNKKPIEAKHIPTDATNMCSPAKFYSSSKKALLLSAMIGASIMTFKK